MSAYTKATIELHYTVVITLDELQDKLGLNNHTEVLQKALQLLAVATNNGPLYITNDNGTLQELELK